MKSSGRVPIAHPPSQPTALPTPPRLVTAPTVPGRNRLPGDRKCCSAPVATRASHQLSLSPRCSVPELDTRALSRTWLHVLSNGAQTVRWRLLQRSDTLPHLVGSIR